MTRLERAISYVEESRETHEDAIRWHQSLKRLTRAKKFDRGWLRAIATLDGSIPFHRQAIREYDFVLSVLRTYLP